MNSPDITGTVTLLLRKAQRGDAQAMNQLFEYVYDDLRRMAFAMVAKSGARQAIDGTALVHAACARLLEHDSLDAENRRHFFFLLGRAIHDIFVEEVRAATARKRGSDHQRLPLAEFDIGEPGLKASFLDLHEALEELRRHDPESAQLVFLRFFSGRTLQEAAAMTGSTFAKARRDWSYARAWLKKRLSDRDTDFH